MIKSLNPQKNNNLNHSLESLESIDPCVSYDRKTSYVSADPNQIQSDIEKIDADI